MFYSDDPVRDYDRYSEWCDSLGYGEEDLADCKYDIEQLEQDIKYIEDHENDFDTKEEQQEELNKMNKELDELYEKLEKIEFYARED